MSRIRENYYSNWPVGEFRKSEEYGVVYPDAECGYMRVVGKGGVGVQTQSDCRT